MAVDQHRGGQLACKIIDLRGLKEKLGEIESLKTQPTEHPYPVVAIDRSAQSTEAKMRVEQKRWASYLERKLRIYYREVEILQHIRHVREPICCLFSDLLRIQQPNIISLERVFKTEHTMYLPG